METISLISTKSIDHVSNKITNTFYTIEGGPYKFISSALDKLRLKYNGHFGIPIEIDIVVDNLGETGSIRKIPKTKPTPKRLNQVSIISTIYSEWQINSTAINSKVFLDIQGMVRTDFGKHKKEISKKFEILKKVFCIKGNKEEISFLPQEILEQQKRTGILIITDNTNGVCLYHNNKHLRFMIDTIKTKDTIGAGDTFFGFVVGFYILNGKNIKKAVESAITETSLFLQNKGL